MSKLDVPGSSNPAYQEKINSEKYPIPEIFSLISDDASLEVIENQIISDFEQLPPDPEKLFLGIYALSEKGKAGIAILEEMAKREDPLGEALRNFIKSATLEKREKQLSLEKLLKIKRASRITECDNLGLEELLEKIYVYLLEKSYYQGSLPDLYDKFEKDLSNKKNAPHLTGTIEKQVIGISSTFGGAEPSYLEVMGPNEILKLRQEKSPRLLLIGSYGKYSAQHFSQFAKKINSTSSVNVIDINPGLIKHFKEAQENISIQFSIANGLEMPFRKSSIDRIFTNNLLYRLRDDANNIDPQEKNISRLLEEISSALKPGGELIIYEQSFFHQDRYKPSEEKRILEDILIELARKNGLEMERILDSTLTYAARRDDCSATIDANGFPHYGDVFIEKISLPCAVILFRKPNDE